MYVKFIKGILNKEDIEVIYSDDATYEKFITESGYDKIDNPIIKEHGILINSSNVDMTLCDNKIEDGDIVKLKAILGMDIGDHFVGLFETYHLPNNTEQIDIIKNYKRFLAGLECKEFNEFKSNNGDILYKFKKKETNEGNNTNACEIVARYKTHILDLNTISSINKETKTEVLIGGYGNVSSIECEDIEFFELMLEFIPNLSEITQDTYYIISPDDKPVKIDTHTTEYSFNKYYVVKDGDTSNIKIITRLESDTKALSGLLDEKVKNENRVLFEATSIFDTWEYATSYLKNN